MSEGELFGALVDRVMVVAVMRVLAAVEVLEVFTEVFVVVAWCLQLQ
jgi:hypothetical protein